MAFHCKLRHPLAAELSNDEFYERIKDFNVIRIYTYVLRHSSVEINLTKDKIRIFTEDRFKKYFFKCDHTGVPVETWPPYPETTDAIRHPAHYKGTAGMEVIDVIEAFGLDKDTYRANAIKYILRAGAKDPAKFDEDLKMAIQYLNRRVYKNWDGK